MTESDDRIPDGDQLIRPEDIAEIVRALIRLSPMCVVPEIEMQRPGGQRW